MLSKKSYSITLGLMTLAVPSQGQSTNDLTGDYTGSLYLPLIGQATECTSLTLPTAITEGLGSLEEFTLEQQLMANCMVQHILTTPLLAFGLQPSTQLGDESCSLPGSEDINALCWNNLIPAAQEHCSAELGLPYPFPPLTQQAMGTHSFSYDYLDEYDYFDESESDDLATVVCDILDQFSTPQGQLCMMQVCELFQILNTVLDSPTGNDNAYVSPTTAFSDKPTRSPTMAPTPQPFSGSPGGNSFSTCELAPGAYLYANQVIVCDNREFGVSSDGDVFFKDNDEVQWNAGITGAYYITMQEIDGNLVAYDRNDNGLWSTDGDDNDPSGRLMPSIAFSSLKIDQSNARVVSPNGEVTWKSTDRNYMPPAEFSSCELTAGSILYRNQMLVCGSRKFGISSDGNIVYSDWDSEVWNAGISGATLFTVQVSDGNLVAYNSYMEGLWSTDGDLAGRLRDSIPNSSLKLDDYNPRIESPSGVVTWDITNAVNGNTGPTPTPPSPTPPSPTPPSPTPPSPTPPTSYACELPSGSSIYINQYMECGQTSFGITNDGDIVFKENDEVKWNAGISGTYLLGMQASDGNLVAYNSDMQGLWSTDGDVTNRVTSSIPNSSLKLDGNKASVVSSTGVVTWEVAYPVSPTFTPTKAPVSTPSPTRFPTDSPTKKPIETQTPTFKPTQPPTDAPTFEPTNAPFPFYPAGTAVSVSIGSRLVLANVSLVDDTVDSLEVSEIIAFADVLKHTLESYLAFYASVAVNGIGDIQTPLWDQLNNPSGDVAVDYDVNFVWPCSTEGCGGEGSTVRTRYNQARSALLEAIENGQINKLLQDTARANDVPALYNAVVRSGSFEQPITTYTTPLDDETSFPTSSPVADSSGSYVILGHCSIMLASFMAILLL